jgi:DNA-binding response OmpR family regulator
MRDSSLHLPPPRVAVVEDEDELRDLLVDDLKAKGFVVTGVPSAESLYRHMSVQPVDVVVLDIGLPGESGLGVAAHLRQLSSVGIIVLTARGEAKTMARALAEGADLFLSKPVDFDVLAAGIANLHRRLHAPVLAEAGAGVRKHLQAWKLIEGGWTLQSPSGQTLALQEAERAFLQLLFAHPGKPVARETLIAALTDQPQEFDPHRLEVLLHRLRTRLKTRTELALPVRAVRGSGYLLVVDASAES